MEFLLKKKSHFGPNSGRPPLCNVRAYKVQIEPIEALAGITCPPIGDLQPSHFYFVSLSGTECHCLKPFLTIQIPTLRGWILISRQQRFSVNVLLDPKQWDSDPLNKLAAVDRVETRWRRHLPNPFLKHGEMQTYLSHFEHERFIWPKCQIFSCLDSTAVYFWFIIQPWKSTSLVDSPRAEFPSALEETWWNYCFWPTSFLQLPKPVINFGKFLSQIPDLPFLMPRS